MIVLGVTETHCATAALLADGRVIGCVSEERWSCPPRIRVPFVFSR